MQIKRAPLQAALSGRNTAIRKIRAEAAAIAEMKNFSPCDLCVSARIRLKAALAAPMTIGRQVLVIAFRWIPLMRFPFAAIEKCYIITIAIDAARFDGPT